MDTIRAQIRTMNIDYNDLIKIRSKDGVSVYRVVCNETSYILKYFENEADRREIENYRILQKLGIPTLKIIASTDCALLMEDIEQSRTYRLGVAEDMNNIKVAIQLARWYKQLHTKGKAFVALHGKDMNDECDVITLEKLRNIAAKTNTADNPVWALIYNNFDKIKGRISNAERTLTYNDFYYTNFIVVKEPKSSSDKSSAFMFDYNLLGKGYVYADIRNVTYSLGESAKAAFLQEYDNFDKDEILIDNVASALTALHFACNKNVFPSWAAESVEQIKNGSLKLAVIKLLASAI